MIAKTTTTTNENDDDDDDNDDWNEKDWKDDKVRGTITDDIAGDHRVWVPISEIFFSFFPIVLILSFFFFLLFLSSFIFFSAFFYPKIGKIKACFEARSPSKERLLEKRGKPVSLVEKEIWERSWIGELEMEWVAGFCLGFAIPTIKHLRKVEGGGVSIERGKEMFNGWFVNNVRVMTRLDDDDESRVELGVHITYLWIFCYQRWGTDCRIIDSK